MPLRVEDAMSLLCSLSGARKMKVAIKRRKRRIGLASTTAVLGGLVGGPLGLAVGGVAGGLLGALVLRGKFQPVPQIIKELSPAKQEKLCSQVMAIVKNLDWMAPGQLTKLVMGSEALQERVLVLLEDFLTKELGATVQYGD